MSDMEVFDLKVYTLGSFFCFLQSLKPRNSENSAICIPLSSSFCSVGWDVKWCPVSRITTPFARRRPFHWISIKSRLMRAAKETSKFQNWSLITNSRRRYIAEQLPIRRKTLSNQSINRPDFVRGSLNTIAHLLRSDNSNTSCLHL